MIPATADRSLRGHGARTARTVAGGAAGPAVTITVCRLGAARSPAVRAPDGHRDPQPTQAVAGGEHRLDAIAHRVQIGSGQPQPEGRPGQPLEVPAEARRT